MVHELVLRGYRVRVLVSDLYKFGYRYGVGRGTLEDYDALFAVNADVAEVVCYDGLEDGEVEYSGRRVLFRTLLDEDGTDITAFGATKRMLFDLGEQKELARWSLMTYDGSDE